MKNQNTNTKVILFLSAYSKCASYVTIKYCILQEIIYYKFRMPDRKYPNFSQKKMYNVIYAL